MKSKEDSKFDPKLQAAMEYLMTYGWAILIISLAVGVLYSLDVLNPETLKPQVCSLSLPFYCSDQYLDTNGFLTLTIAQGSGSSITINKIACVDKSLLNQNGLPSNPSYWSNVGVSIPSGSQRQVNNIICYSSGGKQYNGKIGSVFSGAIVINATTSTNANIFSLGDIGAPVKALSALTVTSTSTSVYTTSTLTTSTSTSSSTSTSTTSSTSTSTSSSTSSISTSTSTSTTSTSTSIPWLSGWTYRRPITINNTNNANTLSNYQVLVTLDTASLISAGKMRSDCGDIRFTDSDAQTLISYWIQSGCNTTSTQIWVKVPSIPASSTKTIYVYYGNSGATTQSSGSNTFLFFDNFETDLSKWAIYGSCSISTDYAYEGTHSVKCSTGQSYIYKTGFSPSTNIAVHVRYYDRMTSNKEEHVLFADDGTTLGAIGIDEDINTANYIYRISSTYYNSGIARSVGWHKFVITRDGTNRKFYIDDTLMSNYDSVSVTRIGVGSFWAANTEVSYFDVFFVRNYIPPEPTTSVGAEQSI